MSSLDVNQQQQEQEAGYNKAPSPAIRSDSGSEFSENTEDRRRRRQEQRDKSSPDGSRRSKRRRSDVEENPQFNGGGGGNVNVPPPGAAAAGADQGANGVVNNGTQESQGNNIEGTADDIGGTGTAAESDVDDGDVGYISPNSAVLRRHVAPEDIEPQIESIHGLWEMAAVLDFFYVFRKQLRIQRQFTAAELERVLVTSPGDAGLLADVHIVSFSLFLVVS